MIDALPVNLQPVAKTGGSKSSKSGSIEQTEAGLDFAAVLMGMLMTQTINPDNMGGADNVLLSQNTLTTEALLPALNGLLPDLSLLVEGQNQATQTPQLVDFFQLITGNEEETAGSQVLAQLVQSYEPGQIIELEQPSEKVLQDKLVEAFVKQESETQENLAINLENMDSPQLREQEQIEPELTVHEKQSTKLASTGENSQFIWTESSESVAEEKEQIVHQQTAAKSQNEFNWQPAEFQVEFTAAKAADTQPKELTFAKQLDSIMQQVVEQSKVTIGNGKSEVEIKLKPEYLGKVHLKVVLEEGILTAKLAVESQAVGKVLESNLNQLKNYMQEQGLNFTQVNVEVGSGTLEQGGKESFANKQQFVPVSSEANLEEAQEDLTVIGSGLSEVNYLA